MLSTTVASPCQTLRELAETMSKRISGTAHAQFAEGLHFSAFHYRGSKEVKRFIHHVKGFIHHVRLSRHL